MSKSKKLIVLAAILVLVVSGFLLSPLLRNRHLDEKQPASAIEDKLDNMDEATARKLAEETEAMKNKTVTSRSAMPSNGPAVLAQATFQPRAHDVSGTAKLVDAAGQKYIRFEDFHTVNGPDLRIYLSAGLNNQDYVDLGALKATDGNINYSLPDGTDTTKYRYVLVWCRAFDVLFSYAELK